MSDEPLEPLPQALRDLLRAEQTRAPVSEDVAARIKAQLTASVGPLELSDAGASVTQVHVPSTAAIGTTGLNGMLAKLPVVALAFVLGGVTGAGVTWIAMQREPIAAPVSPAEVVQTPHREAEPKAIVVEAPVAAPPLAVVDTPVNDARAVDAGTRVPVADPDRDLAAERALIEQARSSLAHSRWQEALLALDRHGRRFGRGRLAEERDSMRVPTLVMLRRYDEARTAAQRFHARYPTSMFATGVDQALRSIP